MKIEVKSSKIFVASGEYLISKKTTATMEACLGTCVGVTLCDTEAGVGGLAHFLLPEPTGLNKHWRAEVYAATGLPLFIQALCDAGARKKKLIATIAGGALLGPVSRQDLDLDIGGKTADVVQTILADDGIRITQAETGGTSGCLLSLDLQRFKSSIKPIADQVSLARKNFEKPTSGEIAHAINAVRSIPQIALKIARMINDGNYNVKQVTKEIMQDQILSAKIIRLCNSAFLGLRKKVDSVNRATVFLGEKLLMKLVVSASVELYFSDIGTGYSLCKGGLFQHALRTAMATQELARFTGKAPSGIAYTAGLLHDIGKVVLDQYLASAYPFFYKRTQIDCSELCEAETEQFGITHPEAGGLLAEDWSLPENLTDAIRHHHYPEKATKDPELTHLVYLADLLISKFRLGEELECLNIDNLPLRLKKLGLATTQLPIIVDLIPKKIFDASLNEASLS